MKNIELWQNEREYDALQAALARNGTTVEAAMQEQLGKLYRQVVPLEEQTRIREAVRAEETAGTWDDSQPVSAFHITERGQEHWLRQRERTEFLHAATHLHKYFTTDPRYRAASFADIFTGADSITPEQFRQLALERMENTGKVTGVFDIDLDKGKFTVLHIMDGWKTYRTEDVSHAAFHAWMKSLDPDSKKWLLFMDRLEGRELAADTPKPLEVQGVRRLLPEDVTFEQSIEEVDSVLNFYMGCWFPVDQVFGTHVGTDTNDNYLNAYANYDIAAGEVRDELEITLCRGDGTDVQLVYRLDRDERTALLDKMRDYCQQQTGQSLEEFAASFQIGDPAKLKMMRVRDVLQLDTPGAAFLTCGPEHGHISLECLKELTEAGRKMYAAILDAEVTDARSTDEGLELTLGGLKPEELERFAKDYASHEWAEDHMTMYM